MFGPHVALIPFGDLEEAILIYNDCEYGFALFAYSRDYRLINRVRRECEFGVGYVNLPTIGAGVHLSSGGSSAAAPACPRRRAS